MLSHFSHVWLFATLWTVAHQAPLSMWILQARIPEWVAISFSRRSSQSKDQTQVSLSLSLFLKNIYLAAPGFSCVMQILSWGMWDLVPWPGIKPRFPVMGVRSFSYWTTRKSQTHVSYVTCIGRGKPYYLSISYTVMCIYQSQLLNVSLTLFPLWWLYVCFLHVWLFLFCK